MTNKNNESDDLLYKARVALRASDLMLFLFMNGYDGKSREDRIALRLVLRLWEKIAQESDSKLSFDEKIENLAELLKQEVDFIIADTE